MNSTQLYSDKYKNTSIDNTKLSKFIVWNNEYPENKIEWFSFTYEDTATQYADLHDLKAGSIVCVQFNGSERIKKFESFYYIVSIYSVKEINEMTSEERDNAQELYNAYRRIGYDQLRTLKLVCNATGLNDFDPIDEDGQ